MASAITHSLSSPHRSVVHITGEVDLASVPRLRAILTSCAGDPVHEFVVHVGDVTFMDCSGLGPLLEARARLGERLQLSNQPRAVSELVRLIGLTALFPVDHLAPPDGPGPAAEPDGPTGTYESRRPAAPRAITPPAARGLAADPLLRTEVRLRAAAVRAPVFGAATGDGVAVEQAKGLLMASLGCSAPQALRALRQISWDRDASVQDVAAALVDAAQTSGIPAAVVGFVAVGRSPLAP